LPFLGCPSPRAKGGFLCEARQFRAPDRFALMASQDSSGLAGSSGSVLKTQPKNQRQPACAPLVDTAYRLPSSGKSIDQCYPHRLLSKFGCRWMVKLKARWIKL
jgi:hypothetical protein